ncbi:MAG: flagellar filament capping protein FliD, partial [Oscillospiraceae bacterium]
SGGQNAILQVNGVTVERSSNTFMMNGLTLSLAATTGDVTEKLIAKKDGSGLVIPGTWQDGSGTTYTIGAAGQILDANGKAVAAFEGMTLDPDGYLMKDGAKVKTILGTTETITTTRNTEQIFNGLKSFVEKYNTMIEKMNKLVDSEATYKKYPPLTAAQKKDMSDREIELWEAKSKEGLLRQDSDIDSFLGSMRAILYTKPAGSDYALYDVGIETSGDWKDKGKLTIDEAKLKLMIDSNPQALQELFSGANGGISAAMEQTIKRTANTSSGAPGSLVSLAGVDGKATSITNTLTRRLREINSRITDLQKKYEKEKARYWKQFSSMESALSNLNSQSGWLSQQFM